MKLNKVVVSLLVSSAFTFVACSDFLDQAPDSRTELKTPSQITKLLTAGYSAGNYASMCELSGDNLVDNNASFYDEDTKKTIYYNLPSMSRIDDEMFAWKPGISSVSQDSPSSVWENCYYAIAVANHALEAIDILEKEGRGNEVAAAKGEALLIRAYHHFILVNLFSQAYRNDDLSNDKVNAMGIPYVTAPETIVSAHYERGTVTEVYNKIEKDLLAGLPLIPNSDGPKSKYHFNKKAANAFAARFFLYKRDYDKVIKYADAVFDGNNAAGYMRNYLVYDEMSTTKAKSYEYINPENSNNLLLMATYSNITGLLGGGYRYACNHSGAKGTIVGPGPTWTLMPLPYIFVSGAFTNGGVQDHGLLSTKVISIFEYTDKVAGIGYSHVVRAEFTAEETLLCRAEAYIYKNQLDKAFEDLKTWDDSHQNLPPSFRIYVKPLTVELLKKFYSKDNKDAKYAVFDYNTEKMSPDFVITEEQKPYVDCLMHFRRIETIFDGLRWFDIKRYGLEIEHAIGGGKNAVIDRLTWDDPRRALQVPQEVIAAGMVPSFRPDTPKEEPKMLSFDNCKTTK